MKIQLKGRKVDKGMHPPPAALECVWQECWRQP